MTRRRRDGFAGLAVVPDHVETTVEMSDQRAAACREAIVTYLRDMADRIETDRYPWVERPATVVVVMLGGEDAAVSSAGDMTGGVDDLLDASQCILAFSSRFITVAGLGVDEDEDVDVQDRVADTRRWRVESRRNEAEKRRQFDLEHPYVCGCGKRCKSSAGLAGHKTSTGHR